MSISALAIRPSNGLNPEDPMKFLCLIRLNPPAAPLSDAEGQKRFAEYVEFTTAIRKSGHFIGANRLQPANTAVTVRVRDGKVLVTDGPFAETKEQLGGYYLIEARDRDEAVQIASRIPASRWGSIEVRQVFEDPATTQALRLAEQSTAS
jgi:hypothetical protein